MGRRRQSRPAVRKANWSDEDDCTLLGLLDFSIKNKRFFPFNEENVVSRLCSEGSLHDYYTWNQIKRRLDYLWHTYGRSDSPNKADIYLEGSACLPGLGEAEHSAIKSNAEQLEKVLKTSNLKKRGFKVPDTRDSSSASPFTMRGDQSHTPDFTTSDGERLTPRAQRHQTRELLKYSKKMQRTSSQGRRSEDEAPRKKPRRMKDDSQNRDNQRRKRGSDATEHLPEQKVIPKERELEPPGNHAPAVSIWEDRVSHELTSLRLGSEIRRLQEDSVPSPTAVERLHRAALLKKEEKIMELQETIIANEEKFDELQMQLDSFGSVQEKRQEGEESLELLVSNLHQEIRHLKRAKEECRRNGEFAKLAGSFEAARKEMKMETRVPAMRCLMKDILGGCEDDTTLKFPGPNVSAGLRALFSFGLRFRFDDQTLEKEQFDHLISNRPPYSIIESLVDAAICTWVFESDFPNFEQGSKGLSLFTKYRELIAAQDGAVALRNLELASYHTLINGPKFSEIIHNEAEKLAASLSKTLAPFFTRNAEESDENVFETWGEGSSVWQARQQRLTAIFKDALKMKADSLLTPDRYELVYYAPGTVFNPATMDVETIDGAHVDTRAMKGYSVETCLHVAIQAFTKEAVTDEDPISQATIQSRNFTRGDAVRPPLGATAPTVLVKAIVVLKK